MGPEAVLGRVIDAEGGDPVSVFQVHVLPHEATPALSRLEAVPPVPFHRASGIFRIDREPGIYDVVVIAPGFEPGVLEALEVPLPDARPVGIPLHRGAGIAGRVLDENGRVAAGVPVFLHVTALRDPRDRPPRLALAHSGLDGSFSFSPLPPGEYAITALEPDNEVDRVGGLRVSDGTIRTDLVLRARHQVQVQVRDDRGRPLEGASIELRGEGRLESDATNEQGLALLQHVPDGHYELEVSHPGHAPLREELVLEGGTGETLRFLPLDTLPGEG
jgi:hypothetical protein